METTMHNSSCLELIRSEYSKLTPAERKVADYILNHLRNMQRLTISELATECGVSEATITRFAYTCGFDGFRQLRMALVPDTLRWQKNRYHAAAAEELSPNDPIPEIMDKFLGRAERAGALAFATIDTSSFSCAVEAILGARKIVLLGNGGSVYLAASAGLKFMKLGLDATSYIDVNGMQASTLLLKEGDVCLAISHTGTTRETVDSFSLASGTGATTIALTSNAKSPLAKLADVQLTYGPVQRESEIGLARVIQSLVVELLATTISLRVDGTKTDYHQIVRQRNQLPT